MSLIATSSAHPPPYPRGPDNHGLRAWWRQPQITWWVVVVGAVLLALRKPWALYAPQFWAEDGSIFFTQDEQMGLAAFLEPYQGYLHLLPRFVAWFTSHTVDVAWYPSIYNGAAFLGMIGVFVRMASPRLDLPGKHWMLLAFVLVAQSGETIINLTNLQWITAFFLVQQALIARPVTLAQRLGDLALMVVVGLTGPFAIVFLPLFVWRWWRDRHPDNLALLLAVGACAAVQGWLIAMTSTKAPHQLQPFHLQVLLASFGNRLVVWPLFGPRAVASLSLPALAAACCAAIGPLAIWVLRPHPRRVVRLQILAAFVLVTVAGIYRSRPDTWLSTDIENADRYCYIPRVLLAWLLIWEFDARPRAVAFVARTLGVAGVLLNLPYFILRAPPNYHWAEHCAPIRRGEPAKILTLPEGWFLDYPGRPDKK